MSSVQQAGDEMDEQAEEIAFDDLLNELEALEMAYEVPEEIEEQPEIDDEPAKEVEEQSEQVDEEQIKAVTKMQALHRGAKERQEFRKKQESIVKLQSIQRGRMHRKEIKEMNRAAVNIQAAYRGNRERKDYEKKAQSIVKLQAAHRGYMDRKNVNVLRKERESIRNTNMPSPPSKASGRNRANERKHKNFARATISKDTTPDKNDDGEIGVEAGRANVKNKNIAKWPKRELEDWGKFIDTRFGMEWPTWSSDVPLTVRRRRQIENYQGKMAVRDREDAWDSTTKISESRIPNAFEKRFLEKSKRKRLKKRGRHRKADSLKHVKTDYQVEQLQVLKTVRRAYKEAAGYYRSGKDLHGADRTKLPESFLPLSHEKRGTRQSYLNDKKLQRTTEGKKNVENTKNSYVKIGESGQNHVDEHFHPEKSAVLNNNLDGQTLPFDQIYSMNAVLKDTSLLELKFKDTCQAIILLWEELGVPYQEQSYVANNFFAVVNVQNYIQIVTHSIFLQSIKSKVSTIQTLIEQRNELLKKINDVIEMIQTEANGGKDGDASATVAYAINDNSETEVSETISHIYKSTRQLVKLINEWRQLADWNNTYLVDGTDYMEKMKMELKALESF